MSHSILLKKLYYYGIRGTAHDLIASYLSNRYQSTCVNDFYSVLALITWGVPQGSVLGPLLFLIFVNDLPQVSNLLHTWLFADDSAFCHSAKTIDVLETEINTELEKVHDWLIANRLSIHYVKNSQFMLIDHKSVHSDIDDIDFTVSMGGHELTKTTTYKYLGIHFDNKLSWAMGYSHQSFMQKTVPSCWNHFNKSQLLISYLSITCL